MSDNVGGSQGAGFVHPLAAERKAAREAQLAGLPRPPQFPPPQLE